MEIIKGKLNTQIQKINHPHIQGSDLKLKRIKNWVTNNIGYCDSIEITLNYEIDVVSSEDVYIDSESNELPEFIQFGVVNGGFILRGGNFETLRGCPYRVGGRFCCSHNKLISLEYAPQTIGFNKENGSYCNFNCSHNNLDSLLGISNVIVGDIYCHNNKLKSLVGIQKKINGGLNCSNNKLINLDFSPLEIHGDFNINGNLISEIDSCQTVVYGDLMCKNNLIIKK